MLEIDDIKVYYGDAQALFGLSLEVGEGEVVTLVGSAQRRHPLRGEVAPEGPAP